MDGHFNRQASVASILARTPEGIKRKEPEKPNSKIHSVIIWRVDPTRNDPRLPVFDGALKGVAPPDHSRSLPPIQRAVDHSVGAIWTIGGELSRLHSAAGFVETYVLPVYRSPAILVEVGPMRRISRSSFVSASTAAIAFSVATFVAFSAWRRLISLLALSADVCAVAATVVSVSAIAAVVSKIATRAVPIVLPEVVLCVIFCIPTKLTTAYVPSNLHSY